MTTLDPRHAIDNNSMSRLQIIIVALTIGLNALDGFDVLAISFASPGISAEWGIDRAALGIVLSMELIGMCIGSIFLGGAADKIGRRPTILCCLSVMSIGMFLATTANNVYELSAWRVLTGLGIGGMLASINAVTAEFSNNKRRHLNVSLMTIGYPIGAVLGGMVTAQLLKTYDWRSVFYFGAAVTVMCIPLVYFLIPESVQWLSQKQPKNALETINKTLSRINVPTIASLPNVTEEARKKSVGDIFTKGLIATTIIVTAAYFFHITTFYFILKWVPKIVVDMGFEASSAAGVLVWANLGGALGGGLFGLLTLRFSVKWLSIGVMFLSTILVSMIGKSSPDLQSLSIICAVAGFCTNAGVVGLYALFAHSFPTHVRAFGTGFAIGVGRGGAVLAPILAGFLFDSGFELPAVSIVMALGSSIAAFTLLFLKMRREEH